MRKICESGGAGGVTGTDCTSQVAEVNVDVTVPCPETPRSDEGIALSGSNAELGVEPLISAHATATLDPPRYTPTVQPRRDALMSVVRAFLPLGFVSFGGPGANTALLQTRFVSDLKWLSTHTFLQIMAVCQALPGPSVAQLTLAIGTLRAGATGGILAFVLFTAPAFVTMFAAGLGSSLLGPGVLLSPLFIAVTRHGLQPAAVAQVGLAAYRLGIKVVDAAPVSRRFMMQMLLTAGTVATLAKPPPLLFPVVLLAGGSVPVLADALTSSTAVVATDQLSQRNEPDGNDDPKEHRLGVGRTIAAILLATGFVMLIVLVVFVQFRSRDRSHSRNADWIDIAEVFYRTGTLVYGGGHVVLPMLLSELSERNFMSEEQFYNGFALVQIMPGPIFNLAAFLGASVCGAWCGLVAWVMLFTPGLLLVTAVMPLWHYVQRYQKFKVAMQGVNATAVGLIAAAAVQMSCRTIISPNDQMVAVVAVTAVSFGKAPTPCVILGGGLLGAVLAWVSGKF